MSDVRSFSVHSSANSPRYDARTIALHWLTAGLVIGLWILGQCIDFFPRGTPRVSARSVHILAGIVLAGVFACRVWWRVSAGVKLEPEGGELSRRAARCMHWALYALVLGTVLLGFANVWVRGDTLFNLITVPAFDPGNKALRRTVGEWHELAANVVLIMAFLHAAAAFLHHYYFKDGTLRRMLPLR